MTVVAPARPGPHAGPRAGSTAERMAAARALLRAAEQKAVRPEVPGLPVQADLAALVPGGRIPTGTVLAVQGSTTLLLALLAAASQAGAWVAFVGAPSVGMLAAADAGIVLARTVLVPCPGPDAPAALAALLDGMDVVVVGPDATLLDADRRRLAARARERGGVLVSQTAWRGSHLTLDARGGAWSGVDHGAGWLRRRTLNVLRTGRGAAARPVEIEVEVPLRVDAVVPVGSGGALRGDLFGAEPADRPLGDVVGRRGAARLRVA